MKKLLAIIFTIALAYLAAYYTTDASQNQDPFDFESNHAFYKIICAITGETDTTDAMAMYARADDAFYYEDFESAIKDYEKAFDLDSAQSDVKSKIADCYLALNDTNKAISVLEEYVKLSNYKDEILNRLGEIHMTQGNLNRAEVSFIEAASINEYNQHVQANLCNLFMQKKEYEKALEYIINAINIYDQNIDYINTRRRIYLKLNQSDLAKMDFERILSLDPNFFPDYTESAKTAQEEGNTQVAIEYYKLALEFNPSDKDIINSRGWLYVEVQEYDSAYSDFDTLIKLQPDYYYYYFSRAYVLDLLERIEESIEDYNTCISYKADYNVAYHNRGYEYNKLKKYKLAEKDYTKSIELKNDYSLSYRNRGLLYYKQEKYKKAVTDFNKSLQYSPNNTNIIYDLARAYDQLKNKQKALSYFNEYLRLKENIDSTTLNYVNKRIAEMNNQ